LTLPDFRRTNGDENAICQLARLNRVIFLATNIS